MRLTRNQRRAHAKRMGKLPKLLTPLPKDRWPEITDGAEAPIRVWLSRDYLVQEYTEDRALARLSVSRTRLKDDGHWDDRLSWDELQAIKNTIGYRNSDAVEVYPRERDVVHVANMRHLWVVDSGLLPFVWRQS